jgi:hypothetical protein
MKGTVVGNTVVTHGPVTVSNTMVIQLMTLVLMAVARPDDVGDVSVLLINCHDDQRPILPAQWCV